MRPLWIIATACAALLLGACSSAPESPEVEIAPGEYSRAFSAAREVLRDHRFPINRVDAAAGVIASNPKQSSGIFTPWDVEQTTVSQELEDSVNFQQRRVRVTFEPRAEEPAPELPGQGPRDLRSTGGAMVCRFEVTVERTERPGRRVPPHGVRQGSQTLDPSLQARGMWPSYTVPTVQDPELAARMARDLRELLATPATATAPAPETPASP